MDYKDFNIEIIPGPDGRYEASISSTYGRARTPMDLPYSPDEAERLIQSLEKQIRGVSLISDPGRADDEELKEIGSRLFKSIFRGEVARLFDRSLGHTEGSADQDYPAGLRIRFVFDALDSDLTSVAALPWELFFDKLNGDFLSLSRRTPVVRFLNARRLIERGLASPPLRILLVQSAPSDREPLRLVEEHQRLQDTFKRPQDIQIQLLERPTLRTLRDLLIDGAFHVLHFMGHGEFEKQSGEGRLIFIDEGGETGHPISGKMLGENLNDIPSLQMAVLNACNSGVLPRFQGQDVFSGVASSLARAGVPAVVAMQFPISDQAAITFSARFYERIAMGDSVDAALTEGRLSILEKKGGPEWANPVLFMSSLDGQILSRAQTVEPEEGEVRPAREVRLQSGDPWRLSIRSIAGWGVYIDKSAHQRLDLTAYFRERCIRDPAQWREGILPQMRKFLSQNVREDRPLQLHLATHSSLAFAAGYLLPAKSGLKITLIQRTEAKTVQWRSDVGSSQDGPGWLEETDLILDEGGMDVAVAIGVSNQVVEVVKLYLEEAGLPTRRLMLASIDPQPGLQTVRSGAQAFHLAQQLIQRLQKRTPREWQGIVHIFASAPNALLFYLGRMSLGLGSVQLYEYEWETGKLDAYRPSLRLP